MELIKNFLRESKAFGQLPELEILLNDESFTCKIYSAKGSVFEKDKNFTAYLFFLKDDEQYKAFYIKGNYPSHGNICMEEAPKYVRYESFESYWLLTDWRSDNNLTNS
jgi:hypothetical protein